MVAHSVFDVLALVAALVAYRLVGSDAGSRAPWRVHPQWLTVASFGTTLGAFLFGSANLWLTGVAGLGRSIEGGLAGGVVAVELLKRRAGIAGSTGFRLVAPLAAAIAVGRIGCFLAGLDDMTCGTPTRLPWGVDFGDGIPRHPVQLYESLAMMLFLAGLLARRSDPLLPRIGFYLFVGCYAGQRFLWEFLKPYGTVVGPFNLFHLLSLALVAYAMIFARRELARPCPSPSPIPAS
jgi:prolipoprotein diacylglyceryltransferase